MRTAITLTMIAFLTITMIHAHPAIAQDGGDPIHWNDGTYDIYVLPAGGTPDPNIAATPEPTTLLLFSLGGLALLRRRG